MDDVGRMGVLCHDLLMRMGWVINLAAVELLLLWSRMAAGRQEGLSGGFRRWP